jgi:hypothetical protein
MFQQTKGQKNADETDKINSNFLGKGNLLPKYWL